MSKTIINSPKIPLNKQLDSDITEKDYEHKTKHDTFVQQVIPSK